MLSYSKTNCNKLYKAKEKITLVNKSCLKLMRDNLSKMKKKSIVMKKKKKMRHKLRKKPKVRLKRLRSSYLSLSKGKIYIPVFTERLL